MQLRRLAALERQKIIARARRAPGEDHRVQRDPGLARAAAADRQRGARRDRREVRRRPAHQAGALRRRHVHRGPDRRGGHRRHDHARRLRQAHQDRRLPLAEARRQGRARHEAEAGRHRRPLLRVDDAPLAAVLHQQGPGLPGQGVRAARRRPGRARSARGEPAGLPAGRADRRDPGDPRLRGRAVPGAGHQGRPGEEDAAQGLRLAALGRCHRDQPPRDGGRHATTS